MTKRKHTPGPWDWETPNVNTHNGLFNAYVIDATGRKIGTFYGKGEEKYANAQLIAAAPEMLEALEALKSVPLPPRLTDLVYNAVAKATVVAPTDCGENK